MLSLGNNWDGNKTSEEYYWNVVHGHGKNEVNNAGNGERKRCEDENVVNDDKNHRANFIFLINKIFFWRTII